MVKDVEIIARGVCIQDDQLLICRSRGADNTFLPGGHVEFGESAREALRRELEEEAGKAGRVGRFLGAVEHTFRQKGKRHCEVNLVFELVVPDVAPPAAPASCEAQLSFAWCPVSELETSSLEPAPLRHLILQWVRPHEEERWASTFQ